MNAGMPTLTAGSLAYLETIHSGLVPCKVLGIRTTGGAYPHTVISVRVTASRGEYRRGELVEQIGHVIPRCAVHVRSGRFCVHPYNVQADSGPGVSR